MFFSFLSFEQTTALVDIHPYSQDDEGHRSKIQFLAYPKSANTSRICLEQVQPRSEECLMRQLDFTHDALEAAVVEHHIDLTRHIREPVALGWGPDCDNGHHTAAEKLRCPASCPRWDV